MRGMAMKFSARPANVMRENTIAPTGNSVTSAAAEAANIVNNAGQSRRYSHETHENTKPTKTDLGFVHFVLSCFSWRFSAPARGATTKNAGVAPKGRKKKGRGTPNR